MTPLNSLDNTAPPRRGSNDRLIFALRACFLAGAVCWAAAVALQSKSPSGFAAQIASGVAPPLLWFLLYSVLFYLLIGRFPAQRNAAHHVMLALDTAFVTYMVSRTGMGNSNFYLGYYLFIASHSLAFGKNGGAAATVLSAVAYLALFFTNSSHFFAGDFAVRLGFMFLVFFVIASISENERKDKERIEEDSREIEATNRKLEAKELALREEVDAKTAAVDEKESAIKSKSKMIQDQKQALDAMAAMNAVDSIRGAVMIFLNHVKDLLGVEDLLVVASGTTDPLKKEYFQYEMGSEEVIRKEFDTNHLLLVAFRENHAEEVEWRVDGEGGIPQQVVFVDYEPAVVHAMPLFSNKEANKQGFGFLLITHSDPCILEMTRMEVVKILGEMLGTVIENLLRKKRLEELSNTDGLTGLFNHKYFQYRLEQELSLSKRYKPPLSLLMFDIDHFKKFNDTYGHQAGDAVLAQLAKLVKTGLRKVDIPARYGGEEFAIILPHTPKEGAHLVAERIRNDVENFHFGLDGGEPLRATISVGVACFPDFADKDDLIRAADQALYRAKEAGRNRVMEG